MAEKLNIYPGADRVAERRRTILDKNTKFRELREIPDEDLILLLGHRNPGERYTSVHPPLDELKEPADPIRELIEPTPGARGGDRIRYVQFTDSVYHSPVTPVFRGRMYHIRYRGVDTISYSGRELMEVRERDLELYTKELIETELFDPARTAIRGITVHGSAMRLDEDGLMFDARRRYMYDREKGLVIYTKNQMAIPIDKSIPVGSPRSDEELKSDSIIYGLDTVRCRDAEEVWEVTGKLMEANVKGGFNPGLVER
ncbi:MAG TPA: coenzyme-B sulfoethylthiotransferase subunit gamma [Candidatus Syntrophoarchaeum butanivorans]|nr:coenzyme-B sulfoethylthiotransferase subunit gamma [Candidatus Syntrophoarchaeum butanivorans]